MWIWLYGIGCGSGGRDPEPCAAGASTVVTDVAGTLTAGDDAFDGLFETPPRPPEPRPDAAALFTAWRAAGWTVRYLSADGDDLVYADGTSAADAYDAWLTDAGFPRADGDLTLADGYGAHDADAAAWKRAVLDGWVVDAGLTVEAAYGNDAWDAEAYADIAAVWIVGDTLAEADAFGAHLAGLDIPDRCGAAG